MKLTTIVINEKDNVATCLAERDPGDNVDFTMGGQMKQVAVLDPIPFGHKIAVRPLEAGKQVIKYGEVIGVASQSIKVGQHVHIHNVESIRARGDNP